ncbi:MAG: ABC transporter permease [Lachnospiraceae bacterium]|nr:ABC transporter permease [Lachnospiraceae bacterium]
MAWIWRLCITNMKKRGIRTFLTILGVVIGVVSIVSLISVGIGAKELIMKDFGGDTLKRIEVTSMEESNRKDKMLTDDSIAMISDLDHVEIVYPVLTMDGYAYVDKYEGFVEISGVPQSYLQTLTLAEGELPSGKGLKPELVMGYMASSFFYESSTGIFLGEMEEEARPSFVGERFQVEMNSWGDNPTKHRLSVTGMTNNAYDMGIYCEMNTLKSFLKRVSEDKIIGQPVDQNGENYKDWVYSKAYVIVEDAEYVDEVMDKINERGFQAYSEKEYADSMERMLKIAQVVLAGIGMIALLVAVIGISNTMMTAVYDRIKEIGILKVLGCDPDELLYLFLLESGILGAIGGALGVAVSYLITHLGVNRIATKLMELDPGEQLAVIPWWLAVAAILFAICLGVIAGYFPARWAAKLRPIDAVNKQ